MHSRKGQTVEDLPALHPLLDDKNLLRAAYRQRKDTFEYTSGDPADEEQLIAKGWESIKLLTSKLKLRRKKDHSTLLEDRIWVLLYRMGYPILSGRGFKIRHKLNDGSAGERKIDVFARDEETCLLIECKSRDQRGRRALQRDLEETETLQKSLANAIRRQFGETTKLKLIWMYATNNIIWSENDIDQSISHNIKVITENELQYFEAFISHLGPAGRFQFLSEFLRGQEIPNLSNIRIPAVRGRLGKHVFYSFVASPKHLLKIAYVNHQALNHPGGQPAYQRMVSKSRIEKIGNFIKSGGYFPTNILINFVEECRFDSISNKENTDNNIKFGWLYLPNKYKSAWVIDGQHRLYGYSHLDEKYLNQSLFVLAFQKMDTTTEANLFVTINHEQKSVPKSLLIALQADLKFGAEDPHEAVSALASALGPIDIQDSIWPECVIHGAPDSTIWSSSDGETIRVIRGPMGSDCRFAAGQAWRSGAQRRR